MLTSQNRDGLHPYADEQNVHVSGDSAAAKSKSSPTISRCQPPSRRPRHPEYNNTVMLT